MNDISEKMASMIADRHRQMTAEMRMRIASQMFDTARRIVESSLPASLSQLEHRFALIERLYKDELPLKAKLALVAYIERHNQVAVDADIDPPVRATPTETLHGENKN